MNSYNKQIETYIKDKINTYNTKIRNKKNNAGINMFGVQKKKSKKGSFIKLKSIKRKRRRSNNNNSNKNKFQSISSVQFKGML